MCRTAIQIALLAALHSVASPGTAQEKERKAAVEEMEKVRCEYKKVVGSRIPQKVCLTEFEWEERRRVQIEAERSSRNRNSGCSKSPC